MRHFSKAEKHRIGHDAISKQLLTGKGHFSVAARLMSTARQLEHEQALLNGDADLKSIVAAMDEIITRESGGRFKSWYELEQHLPAGNSRYLRVFNFNAALHGGEMLVEASVMADKVAPYLALLEKLKQSEAQDQDGTPAKEPVQMDIIEGAPKGIYLN